jgi:hypothetical protein
MHMSYMFSVRLFSIILLLAVLLTVVIPIPVSAETVGQKCTEALYRCLLRYASPAYLNASGYCVSGYIWCITWLSE